VGFDNVREDFQVFREGLLQVRFSVLEHPLLVLLVLVAMVLVMWRSLRGAWGWVGVLFVLSFVWVVVNKPVEGPILVSLSQRHGVTVADLFSLSWVLVLIGRWAFDGRDSHPGRGETPDWSVLGPVSPIPSQRGARAEDPPHDGAGAEFQTTLLD
jgi:hypothetical protein